MFSTIRNLFSRHKTDFADLVKKGAVIIDVRTPDEYKSGHIHGSRNIPLDVIGSRLDEIRKLKKPVITVCRSGARSAMAKSILSSGGLEAYNGGAWNTLDNKLN